MLDEADQMCDLGFLPQVSDILDQVHADGQRLLFSATLDRNVDQLVRESTCTTRCSPRSTGSRARSPRWNTMC